MNVKIWMLLKSDYPGTCYPLYNSCFLLFPLPVLTDGAGGKGTWGRLLDDTDSDLHLDRNDPNYDSGEVY